ncbi:MAG: hypothetical protein AAF282_00225 [Cyanobacteria bacterium P01_A01_bin.15]
MASQNKTETTPGPSDGKQTPLEETSRRTGEQDTPSDSSSGAEPETPTGNDSVPGDPNQGTEPR